MSSHPWTLEKNTQRPCLKKERPGSQEDSGPEATDRPTFLLKAAGRLQFAGEVTAWMEGQHRAVVIPNLPALEGYGPLWPGHNHGDHLFFPKAAQMLEPERLPFFSAL